MGLSTLPSEEEAPGQSKGDSRMDMPERFRVSRPTLWFDRFMNQFIKVGGLSVIAAVFAIFVFIFIQILPLFRGAKVELERTVDLGEIAVAEMGSDEWAKLPFFVTTEGMVRLFDLEGDRGWMELDSPFAEEVEFSDIRYNAKTGDILFGTADGRFSAVRVNYTASFLEEGGQQVTGKLSASPLMTVGRAGYPLERVAYGDGGARKLAGAIQSVNGRLELHAVTLSQRRSLMGAGPLQVDRAYDLTDRLSGKPVHLLIGGEADSLVVGTAEGEVSYLFFENGEFGVRQRFSPFDGLADETIARMDFVLGDMSIVFVNGAGETRVFSLYPDAETGKRFWGWTKKFEAMPGAPEYFSAAMRNKAFLTGSGNYAALRYMTTATTRWEAELPFAVERAVLAPRYDHILFLDTKNDLHLYRLSDPHPQAGWKTFFGKIQYEGRAAPEYIWQSTGGTDEFEPKLSMIPLIVGTLKGTVYAMVFALPIAILAAVYTSQFLKPEIKRVVKPGIEIMASLPSVVLGFLAALWLAPIVSNRIPSVFLAVAGAVAGALAMGWAWDFVPRGIRRQARDGKEFLLVAPAMLLFAFLGWKLGPVAEQLFFVVTDPETGTRVADFRLWFPTVTGLGFEQRNAAVVGFVMGFAVIPIIYTIAEDAMANVPTAFRSGSLALGASRWQTAMRVVLPTASAGIFSAVMIGLGRAVGETMIVVMATGNTPVTDFNIFTGMRTLSANIAVELPEAPYLGTLYRTLFLGAMILFAFTFIINTVAEVMRQRLREKYRAVE